MLVSKVFWWQTRNNVLEMRHSVIRAEGGVLVGDVCRRGWVAYTRGPKCAEVNDDARVSQLGCGECCDGGTKRMTSCDDLVGWIRFHCRLDGSNNNVS